MIALFLAACLRSRPPSPAFGPLPPLLDASVERPVELEGACLVPAALAPGESRDCTSTSVPPGLAAYAASTARVLPVAMDALQEERLNRLEDRAAAEKQLEEWREHAKALEKVHARREAGAWVVAGTAAFAAILLVLD